MFKKKIKPAEEYYDFEPCCVDMETHRGEFYIIGLNVYMDTDYTETDENMVSLNYCPFCGLKFEVEK